MDSIDKEDEMASKESVVKVMQDHLRDSALVNFSIVDGVVLDFKTMRDYCSNISPTKDVRYIDHFHTSRCKFEYVMFKVDGKFFPLRFLSTRFTTVNDNVLDVFSKIDNVWDITSVFIQKSIQKRYKRLPELSIRSLGTLSDPCSFDFVSLMIAYKYIVILKKYKLSIREEILNSRSPVLRKLIQRRQLDISNNGLQFYEWLQSLMKCYSIHNAKNQHAKGPFKNEMANIFVLPFVGYDSYAEAFEVSHQDLEQSFSEHTTDVDVTIEELRMIKLHLKTSRPGPSTKDPEWDLEEDVEEDD